jgi:DNA-binding Lrp family transcriptional regulator
LVALSAVAQRQASRRRPLRKAAGCSKVSAGCSKVSGSRGGRRARHDGIQPAARPVGKPGAGEPHARFDEAAGGIWCQSGALCRTALAPPADPTRPCLPLSVSRCQRRLRELERRGAIRGYRADVDPAQIGLHFAAVVFVTLRQGDRATVQRIEEELAANEEVVEAQRLFRRPRLPAARRHRRSRRLPASVRRASGDAARRAAAGLHACHERRRSRAATPAQRASLSNTEAVARRDVQLTRRVRCRGD